ncbi:pectinesterase family protein [Catenovulum agarivorans]|uniref:pectinesterase family protein n=1 Tax=Catenovulum agarivorans TaxID=1172192 RepID=UPI0002E4B25A|nr:pectinesterase family protein [Catenovulum agarivorans]
MKQRIPFLLSVLALNACSLDVEINDDESSYHPTMGGVYVDGVAEQGKEVKAKHDLTDQDGAITILGYQWQLDGADVAGAVNETFMLTQAHVGQSLTVKIFYTDGVEGDQEKTSDGSIMVVGAPANKGFVCPTGDSKVYFCDDFTDGTYADKWDDLISTYNLPSPGVFDVYNDGTTDALRFTAGTRGGNKVDGELILVKASEFANVPADYALEYKIRPRDNSNTGNKYLYAMMRYNSPMNWYLGGLNMQGSTTSTQVEAGYASTEKEIQRMLQAKTPLELGAKDGTDDGTWYTVRMDVVGSTITAYLNGEVLGSWNDDAGLYNSPGLIGFYTYNRSFEIDYVKVFDANVKPVQLQIDYSDTQWITAADGDALVVNVTAITDDGVTADTFKVESSDSSIVDVAVNGTQATLTPKAAGDVTITFTSDSDPSVQRVVKATIEPAWIMPTTDYGSVSGSVTPDLGASDEYIDASLAISFDQAPTGLGTTGEVRIFDSAGTLVDRIKASGETDEVGLSADGNTRVLNRAMLTLDGATLNIKPHSNVLTYGETYTVTIGENVVLGAQLNGMDFDGLGDSSGWTFTTKTSGPASDATSITVDDDADADFRTVQGALDWVMANTAQDAAVTIDIKNGTYNELLYLRNKDNLTIKGESRDGVLIAAENYDGMNGGSGKGSNPGSSPAGGRSLFLVEGGDLLTIENLSVINTHIRTGAGDQAETIYFNSKTGRLIVRDSNFTSEQDTLLMKGYNWFYNSKISGNVDFIWGYSVATVFENSEIVTLGDSKVAASGGTSSSGGYLLQARVENASDPGFIFLNSTLTHAAGPAGVTVDAGSTYLARSGGDTNVFDNIAFINSKMDTHIADIGWAYKGINSQPAPTPEIASAASGWREYNSMDMSGNVLDVSNRCDANGSCYQLTQAEYEANFCSRAQIFASFNNGEGWDPYPTDTSDDHCSAAQADAWKDSAMVLGGSGTSVSGTIDAQTADSVTFTADGGKFESAKVSFYLVSQDIKGDFTMTAKLKSIAGGVLRENGSYQFPAGLMMCVCDGTAATVGQMAHIGVNDVNGSGKSLTDATPDYVASYGHFENATADARWGKDGSAVVTPGDDLYFKLRRDGDAYYVSYSTDGGTTYTDYGAKTLATLPDTMKVGLFAAPNGSSNTPTLTFEDIQITLD